MGDAMTASPSRGPWSFSIQGRAIAPGRACGPLRRNRMELDPADVSGAVLLAERAVPDDIGRILASAGTLTLSGAVLSHVSLLSREFGKPSVALSGVTPARLAREGEDGLLVLEDVVGQSARAALDDGDVVLLDGSRGVLTVPGGFDRNLRIAIRRVHGALAAYSKLPGDDLVLAALLDAAEGAASREFVLEAAFPFRVVPPGPPARRLIEALAARSPMPEFEEMHVALRERILDEAAARCDDTLVVIEAAEDLEDLHRGLRRLEGALDRDLKLLEDLGGDPDRLEQKLEPVLAAAGARRTSMEDELRRSVRHALVLPDELLRARLGGLFRLLRRARAAHIEPTDVERLHRRLAAQLADERARAGTHLVVPLVSGTPRERALVGGKAEALIGARDVLPEGCRVPRGFVVTSAAYRLHLLGETGEKLRLAVDEIDENATSRKARAALLAGDVPEEVRDAIRAAFDVLDADRLAVRSSATIEDGPLGSLAGLFDTYLGVSGFDDLLDRVRWSWASLWNARALAALSSMGLSPLRASQAVIVQEMIETRSAGVLLSRDPSGRPDTLLINATWGLGEAISQGELAGDLYWVRRSTGELIASETARGAHRIELAPQGMGTVEVPLTAEQHGRPCLAPAELAQVARLARALEDVTGRAQDVEFGFDHAGGLVVFQLRRIVPRRAE
jgi:pyruvate, water dikinase